MDIKERISQSTKSTFHIEQVNRSVVLDIAANEPKHSQTSYVFCGFTDVTMQKYISRVFSFFFFLQVVYSDNEFSASQWTT